MSLSTCVLPNVEQPPRRRRRRQSIAFLLLVLLVGILTKHNVMAEGGPSSPYRTSPFRRIPGRPFTVDDGDDDVLQDDEKERTSWRVGTTGREFDLFDLVRNKKNMKTDKANNDIGGSTLDERLRTYRAVANDESTLPEDVTSVRFATDMHPSNTTTTTEQQPESAFPSRMQYNNHNYKSRLASNPSGNGYFSSSSNIINDYRRRKQRQQQQRQFFQPINDWWTQTISPSIKSWPKLQIRIEPTTTLKLRKTFRPLKTIVQLGADFNTQLGVWQFRSSWEDAIIGGKLTLAGRELQLTKSWQLSVGAVEDLVTRLRFRAAVDLSTWKAYARVGFRTERLSPINVMEGFTLQKQIPLDGVDGHVKLQVKANFALPEPEIEYSTETQRSLVGMGDIEVNLEELNLLLDY